MKGLEPNLFFMLQLTSRRCCKWVEQVQEAVAAEVVAGAVPVGVATANLVEVGAVREAAQGGRIKARSAAAAVAVGEAKNQKRTASISMFTTAINIHKITVGMTIIRLDSLSENALKNVYLEEAF